MRLCIVGAGPGGMKLASILLKKVPSIEIFCFEKRPSPFGLLKYGVAPDHPEVKAIMGRLRDDLIKHKDRFHLFCDLQIGEKIMYMNLVNYFNGVVLSTGNSKPKSLNLPGSHLHGFYKGADIVARYNSDPANQTVDIDLRNVAKICVIGHGNVALDISRLLLKGENYGNNSWISDVKHIDIVGRRGPLDASFSLSEVREISKLEDVRCSFDFNSDNEASYMKIANNIDRRSKRLFEFMSSHHANSDHFFKKSVRFIFRVEPTRILGKEAVEGVVFRQRYFQSPENCDYNLVDSNLYFRKRYDMVIESIGYEAKYPDFLGKVNVMDGRIEGHPKFYSCGWLATYARGTINDTFENAKICADSIINDSNILSKTILREKDFAEFLRKISGNEFNL